MGNKILLFSFILGIPLIAFAVAEGIQAHFNSQLQASLRDSYPDADPNAISNLSIDRLCQNLGQDPSQEIREICATNARLNLMSKTAIGAGVIGLGLLLIIRLTGVIAGHSRRLLLYLFKPGMYLTEFILILLILVYAMLAMSAIYYGEAFLINMVHVKIIVIIGVGAIVGVFALGKSAFSLIKKIQINVIGTTIDRQDAPKLWDLLDQLSEKAGSLKPVNIVVGLEPNFFVTEADVLCWNRNLSGRTLYCSLPLFRILSITEFSAIIGHELGHFKGLDTQYSKRFYPIYRGTASAINSLQEIRMGSAAYIALLPAIVILNYFFDCFSIAESRISRIRELAADDVGAGVSSTASLSSALVKVHGFSGFWVSLQETIAQTLKTKKIFANVSKIYAEAIVSNASIESLSNIGDNHLSHPTDTHPSLGIRLNALNITFEEALKLAIDVNPSEPAIDLMESPERKEETISAAYQKILAQKLGVKLSDISK